MSYASLIFSLKDFYIAYRMALLLGTWPWNALLAYEINKLNLTSQKFTTYLINIQNTGLRQGYLLLVFTFPVLCKKDLKHWDTNCSCSKLSERKR